jgi:DNA-binding CsgD family transcriptional regulator
VTSVDTAKTHVKHIMCKFDVHSREELRIQFADWDFSAQRR